MLHLVPRASHPTLPTHAHPAPARVAPSWQPSVWAALLVAVLVGVLMSTQMLVQPFVWRNWPWDDVLSAWLELMRERVAVAFMIALALVLASRVPVRTLKLRAAMLPVAIATGAVAGELTLLAVGWLSDLADVRSVLGRTLQWSALAASVSLMFYLWLRMSETRAAARSSELRRAQIEQQIVRARLQALRSQIEPHFLFNTLATVRRLHCTAPLQGAQLLHNFLDYLRLVLPTLQDGDATLGQEIDLVRAYLGVVEVRMSGRLRVTFDVDEALRRCEFPPLALATLVENAVKHGIAPAPEGGTIHVHARRDGTALEVSVVDTGVGFSGSGGSGIGLANIRARLHTSYGADGTLALAANPRRGVRALLRLPYMPTERTP